MSSLSGKLIDNCKTKLLQVKSDILNRVKDAQRDLVNEERGGDEGDQTVRALAESEFLSMNKRLRNQLVEIELALVRITDGTYGICEETEEPIEHDRLKAIPWTRLSIEGAEIRESLEKKFAH